ncbi:hypothetical protein BofuT4_uP012460.1 [Botrytis cinerea T4]|uniref:Uncharacterized protein n=1 Tax=Botryotinia fuckeliana (strain T4) TaxID=999810 RepID=G2XSD3_BOTF4|nr:hypothetical protein BofuT4_uP012460.1 [Botrytis cinerea T4]
MSKSCAGVSDAYQHSHWFMCRNVAGLLRDVLILGGGIEDNTVEYDEVVYGGTDDLRKPAEVSKSGRPTLFAD